jgi:hypothetical protein
MAKPLPPPMPPFVELSLYVDDRPERDVFAAVLECLAARGGVPNGRGFVHLVEDPSQRFAGPTDMEQVEVSVNSLAASELDRVGERVVAVEVAGALRYDTKHCVIVTYVRVDPSDSLTDWHPVTIWASGELFSGPARSASRKAGRQLRELFEAMVATVLPSYGSITVDWPLGSPSKLASDPKAGWDYRDFYLAGSYVGDGNLKDVELAATGLAVERTPSGLFVFASEFFGGPGITHMAAGAAFLQAIAGRSGQGRRRID